MCVYIIYACMIIMMVCMVITRANGMEWVIVVGSICVHEYIMFVLEWLFTVVVVDKFCDITMVMVKCAGNTKGMGEPI